ncbi:zinc ribbon domain-containing protein [Bifidobacterium longum]|uniref:zinc ribbon domain-containing protein n=1 Tax=Bifidobacterium longum TaxID=216816 RepID=UPI003C2FAAB0
MIMCPDCGTSISDKALTCPYCGYAGNDPATPIADQSIGYEVVPRIKMMHRTLGSQVSFSDGGNVGDANPGKKGRGKMAGVFEGLGVSASRRSRPSGLRQGIPRR